MTENKRNTVSTSVRLDAELHEFLSTRVLKRKYTPNKTTMDALVNEAVAMWVAHQRSGGHTAAIDHHEGSPLTLVCKSQSDYRLLRNIQIELESPDSRARLLSDMLGVAEEFEREILEEDSRAEGGGK